MLLALDCLGPGSNDTFPVLVIKVSSNTESSRALEAITSDNENWGFKFRYEAASPIGLFRSKIATLVLVVFANVVARLTATEVAPAPPFADVIV